MCIRDRYKNKLITLNSRQKYIGGDQRLIPGQAMGVYYGYVCDGIFQNDEQVASHATQPGAAPGRLIYRDLDGNGVINEDDRCIIGDPNPDLSLGLNMAFKYKGFTLDMFYLLRGKWFVPQDEIPQALLCLPFKIAG